MGLLTERDDDLHPAAKDDRWWSETYWFSFDQPGVDLSATIYPVFRPNAGVCSLAVYLWDATGSTPWTARYGRSYWHLPMPETALTHFTLEGLSYRPVEPLQRYEVRYQDGDVVSLDLECTGLRPPHEAGIANGVGHFDQPCRVLGDVVLHGERIEIDTLGMRDRTWSVRPERSRSRGTAYTYGHGSADDQFLLLTTLRGNEGSFSSGVFTGYLVRDGVHAPLVDARRRVLERRDGMPRRLEVEATDALGRHLQASGTVRNNFANQATAAQFAWMSMVEWEGAGPATVGEDQEVWTPDRLGQELLALDVS